LRFNSQQGQRSHPSLELFLNCFTFLTGPMEKEVEGGTTQHKFRRYASIENHQLEADSIRNGGYAGLPSSLPPFSLQPPPEEAAHSNRKAEGRKRLACRWGMGGDGEGARLQLLLRHRRTDCIGRSSAEPPCPRRCPSSLLSALSLCSLCCCNSPLVSCRAVLSWVGGLSGVPHREGAPFIPPSPGPLLPEQ